MLPHALRAGIRPAFRHPARNTLPRRSYNGPHTTYFQQQPQPPRRPSRGWRFVRALLYTSSGFVGGIYAILSLNNSNPGAKLDAATLTTERLARVSPPMHPDLVKRLLHSRSFVGQSHNALSHTAQMPSNLPCEDSLTSAKYHILRDPSKDWSIWAIFDGHAGTQTATLLSEALPLALGEALNTGNCFTREYTPNDLSIINTIRNCFVKIDKTIIDLAANAVQSSSPLAERIHQTAVASAGSCGLVALYDPLHSVLRVANVGDSRAVLGRWDEESKQYIAKPMSVDHTGFNPDELARIERQHPDESVVDPRTGRVHGIAVSRAFGDARWKWSEELTRKAHDLAWGPSPRPNGVIKTPPYLTAEPEISETRIQNGEHADFLIMASDGLWDNISSEDAVAAVEMWLQKYKPTSIIEKKQPGVWGPIAEQFKMARMMSPLANPPAILAKDRIGESDDDTYYDEDDNTLRWRVNPSHFTVEDDHCGEHLIRNALGGSRQDLLHGVLTIQPPLSRNVRDDITVHVIFFGQYTHAGRKYIG